MKSLPTFIRVLTVLVFVAAGSAYAQTTSFTYQGRLTDSSIPANGTYTMFFRLFAGPTGGTQLASMGFGSVSVANGVFTVPLDFGGNNFDGSDRYLEITVDGTVLTPRQQIRSAPYAVRSAVAGNAFSLGSTPASQFVQTNDMRLTDARNPLAGSADYIQNRSAFGTGQTANFNVTGAGNMETLIVGDGTESLPSVRVGNSSTGLFNSSGSVGFKSFAFTARLGSSGLIMDGDDARTVGLTRNTGSSGETLTVLSGGARVGALNANGGILSLSGGTSTGSGRSTIFFNTASPGSSGTADNSPTTKMTITGDGDIGIGTSAPTNLLTVGAPEATVVGGRVGIFSPSGFNLLLRETTNDVEGIMGVNSSGVIYGSMTNHAVLVRTNNTNRISIEADGNVGIGTTSPDQRLSVSGNASKSSGGTTWAVFSDERLKNIRGRFTPGLTALMQLQPIRFDYKPDNPLGLEGGSAAVGFSAQEVEKVLPEAVTRTENGYLQLHSDPILWTMLNAVKEQQGQIEEQKERIRQQDEKIDSLLKLVCLQNPGADVCKKN